MLLVLSTTVLLDLRLVTLSSIGLPPGTITVAPLLVKVTLAPFQIMSSDNNDFVFGGAIFGLLAIGGLEAKNIIPYKPSDMNYITINILTNPLINADRKPK